MRWSKAFSKTGLLALMLAVVGSGIFFYERQYCGAEQPARYEPQQLRQENLADYYVADAGAGKRCLGGI